MVKYYLYQITNLINGKKYIGITNNPKRRWKDHKTAKTRNTIMTQAIQKYGKNNFEFKILITGPREIILELEKCAIRLFKTQVHNGYNITDGGDGTTGWKPTLEVRKRHSSLMKQRSTDPQYSEKNKLQLNKIHTDKKLIARRAESLRDYYKTPAGVNNCQIRSKKAAKRVRLQPIGAVKVSKVLIKGIEYPSIIDAARELNVTPSSLYHKLQRRKNPEYQYV